MCTNATTLRDVATLCRLIVAGRCLETNLRSQRSSEYPRTLQSQESQRTNSPAGFVSKKEKSVVISVLQDAKACMYAVVLGG